MPEVFRLLYGCGFRVTEVLKFRVRDVDLDQGIITVHQESSAKIACTTCLACREPLAKVCRPV